MNRGSSHVFSAGRGELLLSLFLVVLLALLLVPAPGAVAVPGDVVLCSSNAEGVTANGIHDDNPTISADSRYVAFSSDATNLVPGGTTPDRNNVYRKDLQTGEVVLCSANETGIEGNDGSFAASISPNGRYVSFVSKATNLIPGGTTPGRNNVYRKDLQTGEVLLCSANAAGVEGNDTSGWPCNSTSISSNGRYVAFGSDATDLIPGGTTPGRTNIFRKDLQTGEVLLCTASAGGNEGNDDRFSTETCSINADGRYVAFFTASTNLVPGGTTATQDNVFRKDLQTGEVVLCSANAAGAEGDASSSNPSITSDGRYVVFNSGAGNLVPVASGSNIFRKDLQTGEVLACSANLSGEPGNHDSFNPAINEDGRYVAFTSKATNLIPGGTLPSEPLGPFIEHIFRKDMQTGCVLLCSADSSGNQGNGVCESSAISADGQYVAFDSNADNLIPGVPGGIFRKRIGYITYYFAEGTCRPNFETYLCIQNPTTTDAEAQITYMKGDGTTDTENLTVSGQSRTTVNAKDTLGEGEDDAFDFSTRVESTNGVNIIVERPMYFNYREGIPGYSWTGGHDVMGLAAPRKTFYFAEGTTRDNEVDGKYEEWLCIQNPGPDVANVDITYMLEDGSTIPKTVTVNPTSRGTVDVNLDIGVNHDVSVLMESDVPVVAERPMYFNYRNKWTGGHSVVGAPEPDQRLYFAEGTTRKNDVDGYFEEWLTIQNPGAVEADVEITYFTEQVGVKTQNVTVGPTSRYTVDVWLELGDNVDASIEVNSEERILVERPMYFNYRNTWDGGHDVMGCYQPNEVFYFAEGSCRTDFDPYLCILNTEATDANVTVTYMKGDATTQTQDIIVPAESRYTVVVKDELGEGDSSAFDFSARVECTSGQDIVVERPMYFNYSGGWTGGHDTLGL